MDNKSIKKNNTIGIALIYLLLFGVFNLLVFVIFKERNNVFWLSYCFITLAFIVQIVSILLAFKTADVETAFFGIPLASFSIYYLCAASVIGLLFIIFQKASFTLALVIQLLVLVAFVIIAIISIMARDNVQHINENVASNVRNLKSTLVDVEMMQQACENPEMRESLRRLSETIKYSDPMTNDSVADIEERILRKVTELRGALDDGEMDEAKLVCKDLDRLYIERNKKLAISK